MVDIQEINNFQKELYSIEKTRELMTSYAKSKEGFIIFGAMQTGMRLKRQLEFLGCRVLCFIDEIMTFDDLDGLQVYHELCKVKNDFGDNVCYVYSSNSLRQRNIMKNKVARVYGTLEVDDLDQKVVSYCFSKNNLTNSDGIYMNMVALLITNLCTLRCKDCCTYIPLLPKELRINFDIEQLKASVDGLGKIVDGINSFIISGGEPTLHPNLGEIIEYIRKKLDVGQLIVVTNGTIVPSKEVLQSMKENDVIVRVDDYGEDVSYKKNELVSALTKYDILTFVQPSYDFLWTAQDKIEYHGDDASLQWKNCRENLSFCIYRGRLHPCFRISKPHEMGLYEPEECEFIELTADDIINKEKLKAMVERKTPYYGCRYCGIDVKTTKAGIQLP